MTGLRVPSLAHRKDPGWWKPLHIARSSKRSFDNLQNTSREVSVRPARSAVTIPRFSLGSILLAWCGVTSLGTLVTACGNDCTDIPAVEVSMPATVQRSGETTAVRYFGETVDDPGFPFHQFFLEDISDEN